MQNTIVLGAAIGVVIGLAFMLVALFRKPARHLSAMTSRRISFAAPAQPAELFERLKSFVYEGKSRIVATDEAARRIVFQTSMSLATYGFDFPTYVTAQGGGSQVEVGCASRSIQWGPLVTRAHNQFVDALKKHLGVA